MKVVIINSVGFWSMGWATGPKSQQAVIDSLERAGINVEVYEVSHKAALDELLLQRKNQQCLIWPNAYEVSVFEGGDETVWLADCVASFELPMIGCGAETLKQVMHKQLCQRKLQQHGVPVPAFLSVNQQDLTNPTDLAQQLIDQQLTFPLFVKPVSLSTSKGITQDSITRDVDSLFQQIVNVGENYGYPVLIEEFLPGRDITVAVFLTAEDPIILATYYDIDLYDDPSAVLDHQVRLRDWNDGKWLSVVTEPQLLQQIKALVLPACTALSVNDFTRIDCRFDHKGQLKAFDVNGLPGLEMPFSTTVWQMIVKMEHSDELLAFDTLIALVLNAAASRHQMAIPARIKQLVENYCATDCPINQQKIPISNTCCSDG